MKRLPCVLTIVLPIIPLLLAITACSKKSNTTSIPAIMNTTNDTGKKYLALGDSYTIGQSVAENERFPAQTISLLRAQNISIKDPQYIAVTGWTTANLISAINSQNPQGPFDLVTLLIGVNDQYQGVDTATYRTRFTQLLNKAVELAGAKASHVFVLSIPDYSVTPFVPQPDKARVRREVDWFNAINKHVTLQNNIAYVDITPSSRQAETNPTLIANDGLHPSGLEYKKWAEMVAPLVKQALQ